MRRSLTLSLLCLALLTHAQDAYLNSAFVPRYWKANQPWTISARVRNFSSTTPLITFRVDWRFNNGPIQVGNTQSTTGILPGQYWPYTHPTAFNVPAGGGTLKVWVVGVGETNPSNDTLYFPVDVLEVWAVKSVLMEQFTGTWCQFCPIPNATTNQMDQDPLIVVAKHHNGDEFSSVSSTAYWQQFNANYSPAGVMEQEEFGTLGDDAAYDQWPTRADLRKQGVSPVAISINAAFNEWQRDLTIDLGITFTAALTGNFVVNAYLLEDNLPGPQVAGSDPYVHQQVVREVLGGAGGTAGVIPGTTAAGTTYNHQYTFSVPVQWNHANLRVIAMVTEKRNNTSWTVNVADAALVSVGIPEGDRRLAMQLYPNPAKGAVWLRAERGAEGARLRILALDGRVVLDERFRLNEGAVPLPGMEGLEAGAYVVQVKGAGGTWSQRLVLEP